ncbi:MAG: hypothetical protein ABIC95_03620 [archaeon]
MPSSPTRIGKSVALPVIKREMDQWVKHLRNEIRVVGDQTDDVEDELSKQGEELRCNYEMINELQGRMDRIEQAIERMSSLLVSGGTGSGVSLLQPLSSRK